MVKEYYIFDIKKGVDDFHGDIIIVRAGIVRNNMVSELPSSWDIFLLKDISTITNEILSMAHSNGGRWDVDFSDFRENFIDFDNKLQKVYYHRSLYRKRNFWSRIFGK